MALEDFRADVMKHVFNLPSVQPCRSTWQAYVAGLVGFPPTETEIYNLGASLGEIFKSMGSTGRSQSDLSRAGEAWQALVLWYLNFIFFGTDCVVIRPMNRFRPTVIKDATTVTMGNYPSNTESDLLVFNVPNHSSLIESTVAHINDLIDQNLAQTKVAVIQCKTTWNDNAQIPMLWNAIYLALPLAQTQIPGMTVGKNGVSPINFQGFSYSFVTAPTSNMVSSNGQPTFKPSTISVQRVANLTGGNFWGYPTRPGVAQELGEFFIKNYAHSALEELGEK